jgi:hypothetical protein
VDTPETKHPNFNPKSEPLRHPKIFSLTINQSSKTAAIGLTYNQTVF